MNTKQCELAKGPTRGLVLILVPNPSKSSPLLVSNLPAGGEMRVPQRENNMRLLVRNIAILARLSSRTPAKRWFDFFNLSYDYKPNWTPLGAISTIYLSITTAEEDHQQINF